MAKGRGSVTKPSSGLSLQVRARSYAQNMRRNGWTFLSNHGHVLVCLADNPDMLIRDMADNIGITERAVQQIVADLEDAQVITRHREGRRNRYVVRRDVRFRHPLEAGLRVGDFVDLLRQRPRVRRLTAGVSARPAVVQRDAR